MSTERSPQSYSMEELCDQRTNLIQQKQQAEEQALSEKSGKQKKDSKG